MLFRSSHIRCIVEKNWKYAVYFDPYYGQKAQFEMYDLRNDKEEKRNLADRRYATKASEVQRLRLHRRLTDVMEKLGTKPDTVVWPPGHAPRPVDRVRLVGKPALASRRKKSGLLPP